MWYTVSALMKRSFIASDDELWEENIYLLDASNPIEAESKAKEIASTENCEYLTQSGETVKWELDSILNVHEIIADKITSGTELFSRFLRKEEVKLLKTPFQD